MTERLRQILGAAALLGTTALLAAGLLAGVKHLTAERIAESERQAQLRALAVVMPRDRYDNDPLADRILVEAPAWLGAPTPMQVWRARKAGEPAGLIVESVAPEGYSGAIRLLVGVLADGSLAGVRVTEHRETPGLGDAIEAEKSPWIDGFTGRRLGDPPIEAWTVRKDGGVFDSFAGATITPRAVTRAVRRTLQFAQAHADALYAAEAGASLRFGGAPQEPGKQR